MGIVMQDGMIVDTEKGAVIYKDDDLFIASLLQNNSVCQTKKFGTMKEAHQFALLWVDQSYKFATKH